jgi:hypothetical protein
MGLVYSIPLSRAEMEREPAHWKFTRETADSLVREYRLASPRALGHRAFLEYMTR